eukprot:1194409-Prorocentrum_minimum.AAC.7
MQSQCAGPSDRWMSADRERSVVLYAERRAETGRPCVCARGLVSGGGQEGVRRGSEGGQKVCLGKPKRGLGSVPRALMRLRARAFFPLGRAATSPFIREVTSSSSLPSSASSSSSASPRAPPPGAEFALGSFILARAPLVLLASPGLPKLNEARCCLAAAAALNTSGNKAWNSKDAIAS